MIRVFSRNGSRRRAGVAALVAALCVGVMPLAEAAQPSADQASTSFFQEDVILRQGTLGYSCFRIPTLVKAVDGTLLLFVEGRINSCADAGNIDLLLTRSTDGGKSWLPLQVLIKGDGETRGNPTPIVDKVTGRIALLSMRSPGNNWTPRTPYLQTSEDNGLTWTEPKDISAQITEPDWKYWYATGPVHGIQLEHGPHAGRLVAATYFSPPSESDRGAALVYSDDGGLSWNLGAVDKQEIDRAGETTVVELEDGRLYVSTRSSAAAHDFPGHRGYAYSSDGGESFDRPFAAEDELPTPEIQGSLLRLNAKSQGDARNRILFSAPANPAAREAMTVRSSFDESKRWETWQQGKVISWGPAAYSDMAEIADGLVGLAYEAGGFAPYESIRFARFNEAYLDTPNTKPPAVPGPPVPGPTTPDLARSRDTAYVRGGATLTGGRFGKALALDGVDDRVELPLSRELDLADHDFTWATWFRYSATSGSQTLIWAHKLGPGTTPSAFLRAEPAAGLIRASISTGWANPITLTTSKAYNDGAWHHVAYQRSGGKMRLFIDGSQVAVTKAPYGSITEGKEFGIKGIHLGQRVDDTGRFAGDLDEVRVYRRGLTAAEIKQLADSNVSIPRAQVLRLPMDSINPPR